jgi:acyl-CoA thioesterase FadM
MKHPTYDDLLNLMIHYEDVVDQSRIDSNNHLSAPFFMPIATTGTLPVLVKLELYPPQQFSHNLTVMSTTHHVAFLREVKLGERISSRCRVIGVSNKSRSLRLLVAMVNETRKFVAAVVELDLLCVSTTTNKVSMFNPRILKNIEEYMLVQKEHLMGAWPVPFLCQSRL